MATVTEMRAWLRNNTTEDIPARGRLNPDLIRMYEDANGSPAEDDPDWDLADGSDLADPDELEPSIPMTPERAPRTARTQRAERRAQPVGQRTSRIFRAITGPPDPKTKAKAKKAPPRQSVEKFTSRFYKQLGRMVGTFSTPTGNCLQAQAAMAGVMLEDIVRGTIVDKVLQPAVRAEDKLDKGFALIGPPVACFGIEMTRAAVSAGRMSMQQAAPRLMVLQSVLREGLYRGLELSEQYAEAITARLQEDAKRDAEVDDLIAMIFAEPVGQPEPEMAGAAA